MMWFVCNNLKIHAKVKNWALVLQLLLTQWVKWSNRTLHGAVCCTGHPHLLPHAWKMKSYLNPKCILSDSLAIKKKISPLLYKRAVKLYLNSNWACFTEGPAGPFNSSTLFSACFCVQHCLVKWREKLFLSVQCRAMSRKERKKNCKKLLFWDVMIVQLFERKFWNVLSRDFQIFNEVSQIA